MTFTATLKREAALREVRQRERVYPRLVSNGRMSETEAKYETDIMRAIAADYEALADGERLI
jgi:hypothetical protein